MKGWVVLLAVAIAHSMAATLDGFNVESNLLLPTDQLDSIPQRKKVIRFVCSSHNFFSFNHNKTSLEMVVKFTMNPHW